MSLDEILKANEILIGKVAGIKSKETSVYIILVKDRKLTAFCQEELTVGDYVYLIPDKNSGKNCFKLRRINSNGEV